MATYEWSFDAPTGTFKQHALSKKLYETAIEESVFMDHVRPIQSFGRKQGENVTLTRIANLTEPTSATLTEGIPIPEDDFSVSTTSITVSEIGRAVPYTSLAEDLSFFDVENQIQRVLRDQMKLTLDTKAATIYKTASVKYVPTGLASSTITTNGTAGATAAANLNVYHVEEIRDYLYDTLFTPMIGDSYVGIFRTLGLRGIKRDPAWEEWHKYSDPSRKFNSEVGRLEEIRFIETNHANALAKTGTNSVLGSGVVFGEDSVALAEVLSPELRAAIPGDFGRQKAVAWYGILEFGLIWNTGNAGQARIVHVTSA
jgi:N4-gp56 family major capsid protein